MRERTRPPPSSPGWLCCDRSRYFGGDVGDRARSPTSPPKYRLRSQHSHPGLEGGGRVRSRMPAQVSCRHSVQRSCDTYPDLRRTARARYRKRARLDRTRSSTSTLHLETAFHVLDLPVITYLDHREADGIGRVLCAGDIDREQRCI